MSFRHGWTRNPTRNRDNCLFPASFCLSALVSSAVFSTLTARADHWQPRARDGTAVFEQNKLITGQGARGITIGQLCGTGPLLGGRSAGPLLSTRDEEVRRCQAGRPARVLACVPPSHFVEALLEPSSDLVCLSHAVILSWHRVCSRALPRLRICRLGRPPPPHHLAGFRGIQARLLPEACLGPCQ